MTSRTHGPISHRAVGVELGTLLTEVETSADEQCESPASRPHRRHLTSGDLVNVIADNAPIGTGLVIDQLKSDSEQYLVYVRDGGHWKSLWFWRFELSLLVGSDLA
jgi:hypothetical protein